MKVIGNSILLQLWAFYLIKQLYLINIGTQHLSMLGQVIKILCQNPHPGDSGTKDNLRLILIGAS